MATGRFTQQCAALTRTQGARSGRPLEPFWTLRRNGRMVSPGEGMGKLVHLKARRRRPVGRSLLAARLPITLAMLSATSAACFAVGDEPRLPTVHSAGSTSRQAAFPSLAATPKATSTTGASTPTICPGRLTICHLRESGPWGCSQWEVWWAGWRPGEGLARDTDATFERAAVIMNAPGVGVFRR